MLVSVFPYLTKIEFSRSCPNLHLLYFHVRRTNDVLEYCEKIEVELSTFTDSTNTETPRKLVFSLTCVCVCLSICLSVCAKKFVNGYLTDKLTDLNESFGVCCNWRRIENLPEPV